MASIQTFSLVSGVDRTLLSVDAFEALRPGGTVIIDELRRRTRYFDGRFLAAKDQIRDQQYVLARLSELGRAGGMGVVSGLTLISISPRSITIRSGQGVTPSGQMVLVPEEKTIDLSDIASIEQIDAAFGLSRIPRASVQNRSGLFIVGLRPVEYTANPVASYPTTVSGPRTVQDGDIIEAAAIVLIPFADDGGRSETDQRRSRAARRIFVEDSPLAVPQDVLPLAMLGLNQGIVQWVDTFMVRREVGAAHGSILGLGYAPRALREAHVLQYHDQLREVMQQRDAATRGQHFAASEHFDVLPPAGAVPAAAIDTSDFTQIFFPAQIQTDLSIVPDDELAALVEDSLQLPPIDLTGAGGASESTSIMFVVPVPRARIAALRAALTNLNLSLRPAAPGMVFQRQPLESLRGLLAVRLPPPSVNRIDTVAAAWKQALSLNPLIWYVRRRNLQVRADVAGVLIPLPTMLPAVQSLDKHLADIGLSIRFAALRATVDENTMTAMTNLLSTPVFRASKMLTAGAIQELEAVNPGDTLAVARVLERFSVPHMGEGLAGIISFELGLADPIVADTLALSGAVPELDRLGTRSDKPVLADLLKAMIQILKEGAPDAPAQVGKLLRDRVGLIR